MVGLWLHLTSRGAPVDPVVFQAWAISEQGIAHTTQSSEAWCEASIAVGTTAEEARAAAARVTALYTGQRVNAFDVLGDPVRRRIMEVLREGDAASGDVAVVIQAEFGISQPAVSQHLRVLREHGFASVRPDGTRRIYRLDLSPLAAIDAWLNDLRRFWDQRLDALGTEIERGKRPRQLSAGGKASLEVRGK